MNRKEEEHKKGSREEEYKLMANKARNLCSKQEKCISDIRSKLSVWGADDILSDKIINELQREKFIDEQRYALSFTRQKFNINKWGKTKIRFQLKQKRISDENISLGADEIPGLEYYEALKQLLLRKKTDVKGKNKWHLRAKLSSYAQGRGFEYDLVNKIIDEILL